MTRQEMEQCRSLRQEIKSIENAMRSPRSTIVAVFYKDYRTGKGIPKSRQECDNGEEDLRILRGNLKICKRKLAKRLAEAETFIEAIESSEIRTIFRMYYLTDMSQEEIGDEIHYSQGRVSQIINAYWMAELTKTNKN